MDKIEIQGIEPIQDYFFNSCYYSVLFPIVQYFKKSVIPFMVNGMGNYMFYDTDARCSVYFKYFQEDNLEIVFSDIGLGCKKMNICDDLHHAILSDLKDGMPVIVAVDCYYETIRPDVYLTLHLPHYLLVYGFDDNAKEYEIIEQNDIDDIRYQKKRISMDELEKAHNHFVERFYDEKMGTYWAFYNLNEHIEYDSNKYCQKYLSNIRNNERRMLDGIQEFNRFEARFAKILEDDDMFFKYSEDVVEGINDVIKFMNAKKIQYSSIFSNEEECSILFDEIYSMWLLQRTIIAKCHYANHISSIKKEKIKINYAVIIEKSKSLVNKLLNM